MKITITGEDIERGQMRDPYGCPIALALKRAGIEHLGVTGMAVMFDGDQQMALLPGMAQEWIRAFDSGSPVGPMEFEILLPTKLTGKQDLPLARSSMPVLNAFAWKNKSQDEAIGEVHDLERV